jgi:hypothetical protein
MSFQSSTNLKIMQSVIIITTLILPPHLNILNKYKLFSFCLIAFLPYRQILYIKMYTSVKPIFCALYRFLEYWAVTGKSDEILIRVSCTFVVEMHHN